MGKKIIHTCHWSGCDVPVPPRMWGCAYHWHQLPSYLRIKIRTHYRPGQEVDKKPSRAYLIAALEASQWVDRHGNWVQVNHELPNFNVYGFHLKDGGEPRTVKVRTSDGKDMHVPYQGWGIFGYGDMEAVREFYGRVTHWQRNLWWENSSKGNAAAHDAATKENHMEGDNTQEQQQDSQTGGEGQQEAGQDTTTGGTEGQETGQSTEPGGSDGNGQQQA